MSDDASDYAYQVRKHVLDWWRAKELREGRLAITPEFREWLDASWLQDLSRIPSSDREKMDLALNDQ